MSRVAYRSLDVRSTVKSVRVTGGRRHIAIVVPGIRTNADWVDEAQTATWKKWQRERLGALPLEYRKATDDRISTFRLITRLWLKPIQESLRLQIQTVIRQNPEAKISLVAHSLGSEVLIAALGDIDYQFDHIVLLGSVSRKRSVLKICNLARVFVNCRGTFDQWPIAAALIRADKYYPAGNFGFNLAFMNELLSNNDHETCTKPDYIVGTVEDFIQSGTYIAPTNIEYAYSFNGFFYYRRAMWAVIAISASFPLLAIIGVLPWLIAILCPFALLTALAVSVLWYLRSK